MQRTPSHLPGSGRAPTKNSADRILGGVLPWPDPVPYDTSRGPNTFGLPSPQAGATPFGPDQGRGLAGPSTRSLPWPRPGPGQTSDGRVAYDADDGPCCPRGLTRCGVAVQPRLLGASKEPDSWTCS